ALADSAAIVLWHSATHRASYFSTRDNGKIFEYEDETLLAHGPVRRILSRPEALHCNFDQFRQDWPKLAESNLYHPFGHYSMLPLAVEGQI
ncbi:formate hydrogenlyase transcriptional activator FlhA, partial [Pseudomonas donghuensis]|nr:formate hydrogenlyase transcriptional activator FlhA [Pseudomonas donghuensis]